jgi:hypothetical protein
VSLAHQVSAVIVTRGDVDLGPCLAPILAAGIEDIVIRRGFAGVWERYEGVRQADHDIVYTQDDDCVVDVAAVLAAYRPMAITCNMPEWKRDEYPDQIALVGWGAVFHRVYGMHAFKRYAAANFSMDDKLFRREADRVFTGLRALHLIDVPVTNLPWADGPARMAHEREHGASLTAIRRRIAAIRAA